MLWEQVQITINSTIETSGICPVTIEAGGKLIIHGGTLSNVNLDLKPGATLQIMNGGIIETQHGFKAPVGVKVEISHGKFLKKKHSSFFALVIFIYLHRINGKLS